MNNKDLFHFEDWDRLIFIFILKAKERLYFYLEFTYIIHMGMISFYEYMEFEHCSIII